MLHDIARGLARRVPITKLVALDKDVRPYLASLMISAIHRAGDSLIIPQDIKLQMVTTQEFNNMLKREAGKSYDNYGMIAENLMGTRKPTAAEEDRAQKKRIENLLTKVQEVMKEVAEADSDDDFDDDTDMGGAPAPPDAEVHSATLDFAKLVEDRVHDVITAAASPSAPTSALPVAGAASIK